MENKTKAEMLYLVDLIKQENDAIYKASCDIDKHLIEARNLLGSKVEDNLTQQEIIQIMKAYEKLNIDGTDIIKQAI